MSRSSASRTRRLPRRRVAAAAIVTLCVSPLLGVAHAGAATATTKPAAVGVAAPTTAVPVTAVPVTALPAAATPGAYVPPVVTIIAAAKAKLTPIYDKVGAAKSFTTLNNRTNFSGRHVFVVLAREGDWYKVELPMRPNGRTGFVKATDVVLYQHDYAIHVSLSAHSMVVYKAGKEIMLHLPMEAHNNSDEYPLDYLLKTTMSPIEGSEKR